MNSAGKMIEDEIETQNQKICEGVKEVVAQAIERHSRLGQSIAVWQDDKVVILEADQILPFVYWLA